MNLRKYKNDCFPVTGQELCQFISDGPERTRISLTVVFVILTLHIL